MLASRNIKGIIGILLRYILIRTLASSCGENISFGDNVSIHPMCYIKPGSCKIAIENEVSIAYGTTLIAESHQYGDDQIAIKYQAMEFGIISIEDNVWIEAKCTVLKDCRFKSGCVICANSVVTKNIEVNTVAAGCPARPVKRRII